MIRLPNVLKFLASVVGAVIESAPHASPTEAIVDGAKRPRSVSEILDIRHDFVAGLRGTKKA